MTLTPDRHIVVYALTMWGHSRPLCIFLARLVKLRPVYITMFVPGGIYERVNDEISRDFSTDEMHLITRIRVVSVNQEASPLDTSATDAAYKASWVSLLKNEPLVCAKTGAQYDPLPSLPSVAIIDSFAIAIFNHIYSNNPHNAKLISWCAYYMASFYNFFQEDITSLVEEEASRTGKSFETVACEMYMKVEGKLLETPCLPRIYDHELNPQDFPFPPEAAGRTLVWVASVIKRTGAIVTFDGAEYHPESTANIRAYLAKTSQKIYYAGPLIASGKQAAVVHQHPSQDGGKIMEFLDNQIAMRGARSIIYITFGSMFWPMNASKVWGMLDVLMERKIPFIMSHAASFPWTIMPEDVKERIAAYRDGIVSNWVPQFQVLQHPAVGWCVSHGGHNSALELISAGVPMILWPVAADQPTNAIYLTDYLNVGYELFEVRNGSGLGPIYRRNGHKPTGTVESAKMEMREVLDRAFGEDGEEKRRNIGQIREKFSAAWSNPNGFARREVEAFLDDVI